MAAAIYEHLSWLKAENAGIDPAKEKEYTFAQLLKQVHRTSKPDSTNTDDKNTPPATEPQ